MGYHHCPIEPSDWSDGPDYLNVPECETCCGEGIVTNDYNREVSCPDCAGMGYVVDDSHFEDDVI